jgi:hypothetical protein
MRAKYRMLLLQPGFHEIKPAREEGSRHLCDRLALQRALYRSLKQPDKGLSAIVPERSGHPHK